MRKILIRLSLAFLLPSFAIGQSPAFNRMDSVEVLENSILLNNAMAGGLNLPQFSPMDLNADGVKDLVVFDKAGEIILTFLNPGTGSVNDFEFAPQYAAQFPRGLIEFVLMRDFNCDGKEDIFTGSGNQGIDVWKNTSAGGNISFQKIITDLKTDYGLFPVKLVVVEGDIPAIDDVDSDGDLDILTFGTGGQFIDLHQNMALETATCDSLIFEVTDACWGKIQEAGTSNFLTLNISCKGITGPSPELFASRHSGSCVTTFDPDNDGDKDALISDLVYPKMVFTRNAGSNTAAQIDSVDYFFPVYDVPVNVFLFPSAFMYDVNNDGLDDILFGPNGTASSINYDNAWYYLNNGPVNDQHFTEERKDFLINRMVDAGSGSYPAFFDFNNDGLTDILLANNHFRPDSTQRKAQMRLYENTGTATHPVFSLVTRNYENLSTTFSPAKESLAPTFGDLDADGDLDLIVGEEQGQLHYFENVASAGNPADYVLSQQNYFGIDIGNNSTPFLVDLDRDTDLDLLVGETAANVNYFQNTGSNTAPIFASTPTNTTLGGIDVQPVCCLGYSAPIAIENANGEYEILVGTEAGGIYRYTNVEGNLSGTFTLADSNYGQIWEGKRSALASADLNNDSVLDFVVGNIRGGISFYDGAVITDRQEPYVSFSSRVNVFPNPSDGVLNIETTFGEDAIQSVEIFDAAGEQVMNYEFQIQESAVRISDFNSRQGIYLVKVTLADGDSGWLRWAVIR